MAPLDDKLKNSKMSTKRICYVCGYKLKDPSIKKCPICHAILNPNDLEWRKSFFFFLLLLLLIPIIFIIIGLINLE